MARTSRARVPALAYLRTSSAANVGAGKDSDKRQRQAIEAFAAHAGYELSADAWSWKAFGLSAAMRVIPRARSFA